MDHLTKGELETRTREWCRQAAGRRLDNLLNILANADNPETVAQLEVENQRIERSLAEIEPLIGKVPELVKQAGAVAKKHRDARAALLEAEAKKTRGAQ